MCWICEHPESTKQERLEYLRGVLDKHNWVVIGVHEERYRPPYSYTLGLTDRELPELVITGLPHAAPGAQAATRRRRQSSTPPALARQIMATARRARR